MIHRVCFYGTGVLCVTCQGQIDRILRGDKFDMEILIRNNIVYHGHSKVEEFFIFDEVREC